MTNIRDYLPKKEKMICLQVKLPVNLVEQVKHEMKCDNVETWGEFLTACFKSYLDNKTQTGRNESINAALSNVRQRY
jgi:hypothetical protein